MEGLKADGVCLYFVFNRNKKKNKRAFSVYL